MTTFPATELDFDAVAAQLNVLPHIFPEKAIAAARQHKEAMVPRLIAQIKEATHKARQRRDVTGNGHFFALFLLTEFRATEALPAIVEAVSLPGDAPFDLFGDAITETVRRVLAVLAWDKIAETLLPLIRDRQINEYVRRAAADSLVEMVGGGLRGHDEIVTILRDLLREATVNEDRALVPGLMSALCELYPEEAYEDMKEACARGRGEEFGVRLADVDAVLAKGRAAVMERLQRFPPFMADTVKELKGWACFQREKDKPRPKPIAPSPLGGSLASRSPGRVGRNDPCRCGSGKKFKKCCGSRL